MESSNTIVIVISIVCAIGLLGLFYWFVQRKNPTKVSPTEEKKEQTEKPSPDEIDDPLN